MLAIRNMRRCGSGLLRSRRSERRPPSIFIAKMGQDGHDRGAKVIASAFADLGFEGHMGDLFETAPEVATHVGELKVDAVGVSSLAAGHKTLVPELIDELRTRGLGEVTVIVGGVIPEQDYDFLREAGVAEIFGPGTNVLEAAFAVLDGIEGRIEQQMIGRLNHVAIAVPDLASAAAKYRDLLGAEVGEPQVLAEHGVTVVFVALSNSKIELMTPFGARTRRSGKFLEKNPGGGMHHICFEVNDLEDAAALLTKAGALVLGDGKPKIGAHGLPVLFLHPKDFDGTLIELEEVKPEFRKPV